MPLTPNYAFPYPALSDSPHGPGQVQALATQVDTQLLAVYSSLLGQIDAKAAATKTKTVGQPTQTGFGSVNAASNLRIATMPIADPGYPYKLKAWGQILGIGLTTANEIIGQINLDNDTILATGAGNAPHANTLCWSSLSVDLPKQNQLNLLPGHSGVLTGAHTLYFWLRNNAGAGAFSVFQGYSYKFQAEVIPA